MFQFQSVLGSAVYNLRDIIRNREYVLLGMHSRLNKHGARRAKH